MSKRIKMFCFIDVLQRPSVFGIEVVLVSDLVVRLFYSQKVVSHFLCVMSCYRRHRLANSSEHHVCYSTAGPKHTERQRRRQLWGKNKDLYSEKVTSDVKTTLTACDILLTVLHGDFRQRCMSPLPGKSCMCVLAFKIWYIWIG